MTDRSPFANPTSPPRSGCDVCGCQSVFVKGAGLSLCSRHARLSVDDGWLPVGSAGDRQNHLKGELVY